MTPEAGSRNHLGTGWLRQLTADQRRACTAAYLGWMLNGFDFSILTFLLVDIQRHFNVTSALAGALGTAALLFRVVGGVGVGMAADRWGRKGPLIFSIAWYAFFAFLSGCSTSYGMLLACRALFGIGMGGVWSAGMPLAIEHCPSAIRGRISGLLQSGYAMGVIVAAGMYQLVYPLVSDRDDGWRVLLWLGLSPMLLVVWIGRRVKESPVWLNRQRRLRTADELETVALPRLLAGDLLLILAQTSLLMASLLLLYNSITWWYPTFLDEIDRERLPFLIVFQIGGIAGSIIIGRLSETRLGRRGAASLSIAVGIAVTPLYLFSGHTVLLLAGAVAMGLFGTGAFGVAPGYLSERFPTAVRAAGAGLSYHAGAGIASVAPTIVGALRDRGTELSAAMGLCITASGILALILLWLGPETRGRDVLPAR
jgi:SHS family lactate transporter-like MFS transporter